MTNQNRTFQDMGIAGSQSAHSRQRVLVLIAAAIVLLLAVAALAIAMDNGRTPVVEQLMAPAAGPAQLDRHDAARSMTNVDEANQIPPPGLDGEAGQYLTEPGWLQARDYEFEMARKAASEAAQAQWATEHGQ